MILICFIAANISFFLLFGLKLSVMSLRFIDFVITDATLFINIMSDYRSMLRYLYCTSCGNATCITIAAVTVLLVVSPVSDPRFVPNISSATMILSLVTGNTGSWVLLIFLR